MATAPLPEESALLRYSRVAVWFHWVIAALVVANLALGLTYDEFDRDLRPVLMGVHKSIGVTVLALSIARLLWRLTNRPPAADPILARWEAALASLTHWLFYALIIAIPLSGWLLSSYGGRPVNWFWLVDLGVLPVGENEDLKDLWEKAHELMAYAMMGLIALHVAGAAKHHLQGHRHLLGRMAPWVRTD
jgi:cytochrome b561